MRLLQDWVVWNETAKICFAWGLWNADVQEDEFLSGVELWAIGSWKRCLPQLLERGAGSTKRHAPRRATPRRAKEQQIMQQTRRAPPTHAPRQVHAAPTARRLRAAPSARRASYPSTARRARYTPRQAAPRHHQLSCARGENTMFWTFSGSKHRKTQCFEQFFVQNTGKAQCFEQFFVQSIVKTQWFEQCFVQNTGKT